MDDKNKRQQFSFSFSKVGYGPSLLFPLSSDEREGNENVIGF